VRKADYPTAICEPIVKTVWSHDVSLTDGLPLPLAGLRRFYSQAMGAKGAGHVRGGRQSAVVHRQRGEPRARLS
jgi:hypothetical protein